MFNFFKRNRLKKHLILLKRYLKADYGYLPEYNSKQIHSCYERHNLKTTYLPYALAIFAPATIDHDSHSSCQVDVDENLMSSLDSFSLSSDGGGVSSGFDAGGSD